MTQHYTTYSTAVTKEGMSVLYTLQQSINLKLSLGFEGAGLVVTIAITLSIAKVHKEILFLLCLFGAQQVVWRSNNLIRGRRPRRHPVMHPIPVNAYGSLRDVHIGFHTTVGSPSKSVYSGVDITQDSRPKGFQTVIDMLS